MITTLHSLNSPKLVFKMTTVLFCFVFVFAVTINATISDMVVGGNPVLVEQYPYQADLQRSGKHHCGGAIISEEYILTAAHCVRDYPINTIQVRVGSSLVGRGGDLYNVSEGLVHQQYNATKYDYDVAVLKVSQKMRIDNRTSRVVKLADSGSTLSPGEYVKVAGWGKIREQGPLSSFLIAVALPVQPAEKCEANFKDTSSEFTHRMFCAGFPEGGMDTCVGDSGGPAVHDETLVQYGIVSWGRGCARSRFPGVYTAVPIVRDWIQQVTGI